MEIYLFRHGETEWTLSRQHTSKTDLSLTEQGKTQALLLYNRIKKIPFDAVFCSPLQRAKQTCEAAHLQPTIDPDLTEWDYGDYEGLTHSEIKQKDPAWSLFDKGAPHGESPSDVGRRADRFLQRLSLNHKKIAVFSHGHFSRVLVARWLGLSPQAARYFILSVASMSILGVERERHVIRLWNDTSHLAS